MAGCRILVTGRTGQLGPALARTCAGLGEVTLVGRDVLDLADPGSIRRAVREFKPDLILNAAAYTDVERAEDEPALATMVNGIGPGLLAVEAAGIGAGLVHFSTDYVFDGTRSRPYREGDPTGPVNAYGRSKLAGEAAIRAAGVDHLILRTSWLYAESGRNFMTTILRLAGERDTLRIVADQLGAPTTAEAVAAATATILAQAGRDNAAFLRDKGGTVHLVCRGRCSWKAFAEAVIAHARSRGIALAVREIVPITTAEYWGKARRPINSMLSTNLLRRRFGVIMPTWRQALDKVWASGAKIEGSA